MKCEKCGEEINLTIFGTPNDICWGCLNKDQQLIAVTNNASAKNNDSSEADVIYLERKLDEAMGNEAKEIFEKIRGGRK